MLLDRAHKVSGNVVLRDCIHIVGKEMRIQTVTTTNYHNVGAIRHRQPVGNHDASSGFAGANYHNVTRRKGRFFEAKMEVRGYEFHVLSLHP